MLETTRSDAVSKLVTEFTWARPRWAISLLNAQAAPIAASNRTYNGEQCGGDTREPYKARFLLFVRLLALQSRHLTMVVTTV